MAEDLGAAGARFLANTGAAAQQGVELAQMQEKVQADRTALEKQQLDLQNQKFNTVTGMIGTLSKANPKIARMMLPKVKERMRALGVPVDDAVLESYASDDEWKKRWLSASGALSKGLSPEAQAEGLQSLSDLVGHDNAIRSLLETRQMEAREAAQIRSQERQLGMMLSKEERAAAREERKVVRQDTKELSKELSKDALPDLMQAVLDVDEEIKKFNNGIGFMDDAPVKGLEGMVGFKSVDLPFVGPIGENLLTPGQKKIKQLAARVRNLDLKKLSGGAVTDSEAGRFKAAFGEGLVRNASQVQDGLQILNKALIAAAELKEKGYDPAAVETLASRGALTSRALPRAAQQAETQQPPLIFPDRDAAEQAMIQKMQSEGYTPAAINSFLQSKKAAQGGR